MRKNYDFSGGKRSAVVPSLGKTRITIMLDDDILEFFHIEAEAKGVGFQTMINTAPRQPLAALRKILLEELKAGPSRKAA